MQAPTGIRRIDVESAADMYQAVLSEVGQCSIFISVAAVADYRVKNRSEHKLKKSTTLPTIELEENTDILRTVASLPAAPFCVGFAAESQNLIEFAEAKRQRKKIPLLVANLVSTAMGSDNNEVALLDAEGITRLPLKPKEALAHDIVEHIAHLLATRTENQSE